MGRPYYVPSSQVMVETILGSSSFTPVRTLSREYVYGTVVSWTTLSSGVGPSVSSTVAGPIGPRTSIVTDNLLVCIQQRSVTWDLLRLYVVKTFVVSSVFSKNYIMGVKPYLGNTLSRKGNGKYFSRKIPSGNLFGSPATGEPV